MKERVREEAWDGVRSRKGNEESMMSERARKGGRAWDGVRSKKGNQRLDEFRVEICLSACRFGSDQV